MRAVHFGAGNIGRGFIGLMLYRSGYKVCFVARNDKQIALLQRNKQYTVTLANEAADTSVVKNVTAIPIQNEQLVAKHVEEADLITTAIGASVLPDIAKVIAKGIQQRLSHHPTRLHIMACENAINGSSQLKKWVYTHLPKEWHPAADEYISFPNTTVDRIVPAQTTKDALSVNVEPYYEWIIQRVASTDEFSPIKGAQYVDSLEPYVERKLFTVNTGHCCAAYLGHSENYKTIQEVMEDDQLRYQVERTLEETSQLLIKKHGFGVMEHKLYVNKTLKRFENASLTDKVLRVGRSPLRKLAANERLVRPALQAHDLGIEVPYLSSAIASALLFHDEKDLEAVILQAAIQQKGVGHVVQRYMGIPDNHLLHQQILRSYELHKSNNPLRSAAN